MNRILVTMICAWIACLSSSEAITGPPAYISLYADIDHIVCLSLQPEPLTIYSNLHINEDCVVASPGDSWGSIKTMLHGNVRE